MPELLPLAHIVVPPEVRSHQIGPLQVDLLQPCAICRGAQRQRRETKPDVCHVPHPTTGKRHVQHHGPGRMRHERHLFPLGRLLEVQDRLDVSARVSQRLGPGTHCVEDPEQRLIRCQHVEELLHVACEARPPRKLDQQQPDPQHERLAPVARCHELLSNDTGEARFQVPALTQQRPQHPRMLEDGCLGALVGELCQKLEGDDRRITRAHGRHRQLVTARGPRRHLAERRAGWLVGLDSVTKDHDHRRTAPKFRLGREDCGKAVKQLIVASLLLSVDVLGNKRQSRLAVTVDSHGSHY
ncbi:hypothetical protein VDGL01_11515 [Verticillium dahliae]